MKAERSCKREERALFEHEENVPTAPEAGARLRTCPGPRLGLELICRNDAAGGATD